MTEFTRRDALQYVGLPVNKVIKVPMLVPDFSAADNPKSIEGKYFLWTTNIRPSMSKVFLPMSKRRFLSDCFAYGAVQENRFDR